MNLPGPAHRLGYTIAQLEEIFETPERLADFNHWMRGQTALLDNKLGVITYTADVLTYLSAYEVID